MKGFFVTGTDTGVGKTFVAAALARRAVERNLGRVFAFKPIETGCVARYGEDQEELARAAGDWQQDELRGLYQFAFPAAPRVAAEAEGRTIELESIVRTYVVGARDGGLAIVEGAGGWRVPITDAADMAALARRLELPVIIVARATLGTINHSLLTIEAVQNDGCSVAALVLSRRPDDDAAFAASNAREIARRWSGTIIELSASPSSLDALLV